MLKKAESRLLARAAQSLLSLQLSIAAYRLITCVACGSIQRQGKYEYG